MAKTIRTYTGDGSRVLYPIDFDLGYILQAHVYVYQGTDFTNQVAYTWTSSSEIQLNAPVASGTELFIRRVVPRNAAVNDYTDGAILHEENLDNSFEQSLMILEEIEDGYIDVTGTFSILSNLDLNGNDIVDVNQVQVQGITIQGQVVLPDTVTLDNEYSAVSDVISANILPGMLVRTLGRTTAGDDGQGDYLCKTSDQAATDGDVIDEIGAGFTLTNGNVIVLQDPQPKATQFGMDGSTVESSTKLKAFLDYAAAKGGIFEINVPVRTGVVILTSNAKPFTLFFTDIDNKISADSKATPVNFVSCTGITFVHPNIDGRANEQGALLEADGIYHGMVWLDCTDMYAYKPYIENHNGSSILAYKSTSGPLRNFILDGYTDGRGEGENRNGFLLVDAVDSEIINCHATGFAAFALELKNECVNCAIRGGKAENSAFATGCGQIGATAPGVGGVRDSVIEGVIVKDCDQAYVGGYTRNVHVDLPVVDQRTLPGLVITDFGFRLTNCEESTVRFRQFMGDVEVGQFWTDCKKCSAIIDEMESESSRFVDFNAASEDCHIEIKRAFKDTAGTVTEYEFIRDLISDLGTNNSFKYLGGDKRLAANETTRFITSTQAQILGSTSTSVQDIISLFTLRANEFIQEGDELVVDISGSISGSGNKGIYVYFSGGIEAQAVTSVTTASSFNLRYVISATGGSSQYYSSGFYVDGANVDVGSGTKSVGMGAGAAVSLKGRCFAADGVITIDRVKCTLAQNNL